MSDAVRMIFSVKTEGFPQSLLVFIFLQLLGSPHSKLEQIGQQRERASKRGGAFACLGPALTLHFWLTGHQAGTSQTLLELWLAVLGSSAVLAAAPEILWHFLPQWAILQANQLLNPERRDTAGEGSSLELALCQGSEPRRDRTTGIYKPGRYSLFTQTRTRALQNILPCIF